MSVFNICIKQIYLQISLIIVTICRMQGNVTLMKIIWDVVIQVELKMLD